MPRSRTLRGIAAAAALLWATGAGGDEQASARSVVDETVSEVLAILRDDELSSEARRQQLEAIAHERFDFQTMSRLVLAKDWRRLSGVQQAEFVDQFERHLAARYGSRIESYRQESIDVIGERSEPRGDVTVITRIRGGQFDGTQVDYRLRRKDGVWRVIDVVIEGVSLVSSFRAQFTELLSRGGPEALLERLRAKNAEASAA